MIIQIVNSQNLVLEATGSAGSVAKVPTLVIRIVNSAGTILGTG